MCCSRSACREPGNQCKCCITVLCVGAEGRQHRRRRCPPCRSIDNIICDVRAGQRLHASIHSISFLLITVPDDAELSLHCSRANRCHSHLQSGICSQNLEISHNMSANVQNGAAAEVLPWVQHPEARRVRRWRAQRAQLPDTRTRQ